MRLKIQQTIQQNYSHFFLKSKIVGKKIKH